MSSFKLQEKYIPERCDCCGQTKTYLLPIDKGSVNTLKALSVAIYNKGINCIHPRKEMEVPETENHDLMVKDGHITSNMTGNMSKLRFHGLIAKTGEQAGNYCLTTKASDFRKGKLIPRYAIISKVTKHKKDYWMPEKYQVSIKDFSSDEEYWEGIKFNIVGGHIIKDIVQGEHKQLFISSVQ